MRHDRLYRVDEHFFTKRIVGNEHRSEFTLDPGLALRTGRQLDAMLASAPVPGPRGVTRATHPAMNKTDDQYQLEASRLLNPRR